MSRSLICNVIPNELVHIVKSSQAVNNFCFNLIDNNCFDKVYSIVPLSYSDDRIVSDKSVKYFANKKYGNKILGIISLIIGNVKCAFNARKTDTIWFYNIVNANILSYLLLRYIFRKNVFVILLDYTPCYNKFSIQAYIPDLIKKSYGLISLSSRTEITHENIDYIAGIIPVNKISADIIIPNKKLKFLFSGNMGRHTGFGLVLDVFKNLPECELYVSGSGELSTTDFSPFKNIKYLGYLSYEKYLKLYAKVDVCLSFRDPEFAENNNNFPSKILEYFSYNKIVLSTINYPELKCFKYFSCDYELTEVMKTIKQIGSLDKDVLKLYYDNSDALKNNFSEIKWINTLNKIEENSNASRKN